LIVVEEKFRIQANETKPLAVALAAAPGKTAALLNLRPPFAHQTSMEHQVRKAGLGYLTPC
jgi:hypothetical protein